MDRNRVVAAILATGMLTAVPAVSGCGQEAQRDEQTSSAPGSGGPPSNVPGQLPDSRLTDAPGVVSAKASVVKIRGESPNCTLEGSGVVVAPHRVMTPAQIVRGGDTFTVDSAGRGYEARVVSYDPHRNLAILDVPDSPAVPLPFAAEAVAGSEAVVLGYSEADDLVAIPVKIREVIQLKGPDIDHTTTVSRDVYLIEGRIKDALGGPVVNRDGQVLGVSFGAAVDDPDLGFALTAKEVAPQLAELAGSVPVATGREKC